MLGRHDWMVIHYVCLEIGAWLKVEINPSEIRRMYTENLGTLYATILQETRAAFKQWFQIQGKRLWNLLPLLGNAEEIRWDQ